MVAKGHLITNYRKSQYFFMYSMSVQIASDSLAVCYGSEFAHCYSFPNRIQPIWAIARLIDRQTHYGIRLSQSDFGFHISMYDTGPSFESYGDSDSWHILIMGLVGSR